jgi:pimeloyl-ACP methyl ester carboxylesterase
MDDATLAIRFDFVGLPSLPAGMKLHVAGCGDPEKPLLLLLHGFPEYWAAWSDVMPLLAHDFHVLAPDLRGFNLSAKPDAIKDYRAAAVAADVLALLDHYGHDKALVAAHDWGGAIAWKLAISDSERIAALAICNAPHPYLFAMALMGNEAQQKASAYMNWLRKPGAEDLLLADNCGLAEKFFLGVAAQGGRLPIWWTPTRRAAYKAAWLQPGAMRAGTNYYRAAPWYPGQPQMVLDPQDFIAKCPSLVIWGEDDQALLPLLLDGLDSLVPELRIERLSRASHWLLHEHPVLIAQMLRDFFMEHLSH